MILIGKIDPSTRTVEGVDEGYEKWLTLLIYQLYAQRHSCQ